jgi:hypothetical protein
MTAEPNERIMARNIWQLTLHTGIAVLGSMLIGIGPEAAIGRYYYNTYIEPYSPAILLVSMVLGYSVNRKMGNRAAQWVWVPGVLWLLIGVYDTSRYPWGSSRLQYVVDNLFSPATKCGDSECLGEVLFTTVFAATVGYSIAAVVGLRSYIRRHPVSVQASAQSSSAQ